ncbi:hypothetical protein L873DRAFT_1836413 [Choiromyces venosus 120613-1]|uniref:HIT-type domain-containing protein n=1 Tax=Choiromyces venosus 120613-1 TaxID=1336337 RepID=A0A3N4JKU4_9PEZI|nr:hypothetical protein L873DRAFT_1836413 [Choiromyces venosus 120613-1]
MAVCGICEEAESKYKCPTCKVPYCSLACYKPHKAEHEANPLPPPPPPPPSEPPAATTTTIPEVESENQDPFAPLLTTPLTPSLRKHLLAIHAATQKPAHNPNSNYRGRGGRGRGRGRGGRGGGGGGGGHETPEREWTEEQGTKAAIGKLRRLREEGNEEIEEFVQMVVGLIEKETEQGDALP